MLTLNINLLWTVVNLIVLTLLLKKFLFAPVQKVMKEREALIEGQINDAKQKNEEANSKLAQADVVVKNAQNEAQKEADLLLEDTKTKNNHMIAQAQKEAEKIIEDSRVKAQKERAKLLDDAKEEMITISLDAAKNIARANISEEEESKLFEEMLLKVGTYNE